MAVQEIDLGNVMGPQGPKRRNGEQQGPRAQEEQQAPKDHREKKAKLAHRGRRESREKRTAGSERSDGRNGTAGSERGHRSRRAAGSTGTDRKSGCKHTGCVYAGVNAGKHSKRGSYGNDPREDKKMVRGYGSGGIPGGRE